MEKEANRRLQQAIARETVKIRRANNGFVINSTNGMAVATDLNEVKAFLDKKFGGTVDTK